MTNEETLKAIQVCAEFLCSECPYKIYEHEEYKMRCIHKLMVDIDQLIKDVGLI